MAESESQAVLLVSPVDLSRDSAGKIYLNALLDAAPEARFVHERLPWIGKMAYNPTSGRVVRAAASLAARIGAWQRFKLLVYRRRQLDEDFRRVVRLVQEHHTTSIWITLSTLEAIFLAERLSKLDIPLRVTVWDALEHLLQSQHVHGSMADRLERAFATTLRAASAVSVIGTNMHEMYKQRYGVDAWVIRPGAFRVEGGQDAGRSRSTLRLVFAGSLYAKTEWNALVSALNARNWTICGRRVVLYFLGSFPFRGASQNRRVVQLGFRPTAQAMAIASRCDLAYLPYWFSSEHKTVASTSFPSKLATYVSCGLPVLNHGPAYTEATRIMQDFPIGASCHSLAGDAIVSALEILADSSRTVTYRNAMRRLVDTELSTSIMRARFTEFIA